MCIYKRKKKEPAAPPPSPRTDISSSNSSDEAYPIELIPIVDIHPAVTCKAMPSGMIISFNSPQKDGQKNYDAKQNYNDEIKKINNINVIKQTFMVEYIQQSKLYARFKGTANK